MNTRFIEAFLWVSRLGSFRAAAERMHISQAAISNRIGSLEEEIGVRLIDRDSRDFRLTPAGLRLLDHGAQLLELQQQIFALGSSNQDMFGRVHIGTIDTVVHTWLVGFMRRMQASYPGIEVQLSSETTDALHKRLHQGSIDVALQTEPVQGEGVINMPCKSMAMGWIGPAGRQPVLALSDILNDFVITMSPGSQPHLALKEVYRQAGLPLGKVHCVSSISAIVRLVKAGFGPALMPLAPVRVELDRGELSLLTAGPPLPPLRMMVSYASTPGSPAIRAVAELARLEADRYAEEIAESIG